MVYSSFKIHIFVIYISFFNVVFVAFILTKSPGELMKTLDLLAQNTDKELEKFTSLSLKRNNLMYESANSLQEQIKTLQENLIQKGEEMDNHRQTVAYANKILETLVTSITKWHTALAGMADIMQCDLQELPPPPIGASPSSS